MSKTQAIAIFDIGKTNKKFLIFDQQFAILHEEQLVFEEIKDEDGYPCDDFSTILTWMKNLVVKWKNHDTIEISALNFTTYGATLAHIDNDGQLVTPVYNYLKQIDEKIFDSLFDKYGREELQLATGAPFNNMLNSGLHLYWLSKAKPDVYKKVATTLHLPQYLHFCFTGQEFADHTSIGCHTSMWDIVHLGYHQWLQDTGLVAKLPPPSHPQHYITNDDGMKIGIGIHDSSSALYPYLRFTSQPFVLISTGTWSICLNPFYNDAYTAEDMELGCLNYLRPDGNPVRASRLFLGKEHEDQLHLISHHFHVEEKALASIYDEATYKEAIAIEGKCFTFLHIDHETVENRYSELSNASLAYHRLSIELAMKQVQYLDIAMKGADIKEIYIDGGFIHNKSYLKFICDSYPDKAIFIAESPVGTALGAALMMSDTQVDYSSIQNFKVKKLQ
jgi:L-fuculokinase